MSKTLNVVPATTQDYRRLAERRLPRFLFDYIDGGANDEITMASNLADFARLRLRQRVLTDVSNIDTSTIIAGERAALPLILSPVGMAGMMARRGEVQALRAAAAAGVPFTLSTLGVCSLTELLAASQRPFWFQLYMMRDRQAVERLLADAAQAGCTTLVFTVDLAVAGMRHRDTRNGMVHESLRAKFARARQICARPGWVLDVGVRGKPHSIGNLANVVPNPTDLNAYKHWIDSQFDPSVTWKDIDWLRKCWPGRLMLKGIQEPDDARRAVDVGGEGVIVSNHGGRQLDGVCSAIAKLPGVVDAVGRQAEVYVDGGVRSGVDVLKAVSLGARGAMIGRPWVWAVAGAGQAGLEQLIGTFKRELAVAMALAGVTRIAEAGPHLVDHLDAGSVG